MNIKMRAFFTIDQFLFCPGRSYIKKMSPFFYHWPVFIHAQDNRAASGESRPDPIATNPQHKCSRLNGSCKYPATRGNIFKKLSIIYYLYIFSFSAHFEKEGGDVVADQHLHRLHHRQLPHCENHSKRLGDCPQVRSLFLVSSFLKNYESPVENVLRPGQFFLASR